MVLLPTSDELRELEAFGEPHCVSVYAPPAEQPGTSADNPARIELRNLFDKAETELLGEGLEPWIARKILRPAREFVNSRAVWPLHNEAIVLFTHPDLFRCYHLPAELPYLVSIGSGFRLEPLQDVLRNNRSYLVLALSHKHVRMFEGDRFHIRALRLKNFPADMKESLNIDEYPNTSEARRASPAGNRRRSEITHTEYSESQTDKEMLLLFFRKIDASLRKFLQRRGEPLILAGVEYLLPIYRQANTSPHLVPGGLIGNFEDEHPDSIRRRAWKLIESEER